LDQTINSLTKSSERPNSPIIETIEAAAQTSFGSMPEDRHIALSMTLVSDMIQNSSALNQYAAPMDFASFSKTREWPSLRPKLEGAAVRVLYVLRDAARKNGQAIQDRGHQSFWEDLLTASGGRVQTIETI
jgi:hypothetical protein